MAELADAPDLGSATQAKPGGFRRIPPNVFKGLDSRGLARIRPTSGTLSGTPAALEQTLRKFAARLRRDFAGEIARDPAGFKKHVLKLIRRELPPKRGRPNDPRLDAAARMVQKGKSVRDVLRLQIPGFDRLDTYGRYLAEKGLRAGVARRKSRIVARRFAFLRT